MMEGINEMTTPEDSVNEKETNYSISNEKGDDSSNNDETTDFNMEEEEKRFLRIIKKIQNLRNRACFQNILEFARRENKNINMVTCKAIIDDLVERKLVINRAKVGQCESFRIVDQICKEKDPPSKDIKLGESIEDLFNFFDDKFLNAITNIIKKEVKTAINIQKNEGANDNNETIKISLENNYLKETINSQNKEISFLRNELLSRDKIVEILVGDKTSKTNLESKSNYTKLNPESKVVKSQTSIDVDKFTEITSNKVEITKRNRSIVVLGDSLLKDIEQHRVRKGLQNNEKVYVKHFSGATTNHMHSYVKPSKDFNNELVILHCGTNDLRSEKQPLEIANEIMDLASEMKTNINEVMVSGIVQRRDKLNDKGKQVNQLLQSSCISKNFPFYR